MTEVARYYRHCGWCGGLIRPGDDISPVDGVQCHLACAIESEAYEVGAEATKPKRD